jgi:hypothetical protein
MKHFLANEFDQCIGFSGIQNPIISQRVMPLAEIRINGEQFEYRESDHSLRIAVPK